MLRMQPFSVEYPDSLTQAQQLLQCHGARAKICAGGTDLVPNLKHELHDPDVVVHLARIRELRGIQNEAEQIIIGAMTTIDEISQSEMVKTHAPGLALAATHVAGPQLRRMGTIGGNLCLDTRCLYYNQSYFWREALGFCLKKDGDTCHVTKTGKRCVAAASNDCATILLCLEATVDILGPKGTRSLTLDDFYVANGEKNNALAMGELVVQIRVPKHREPATRRYEGFAKLRHRESIDYPMLSIAVRFDMDAANRIAHARMTVNALAAKPKAILCDWLKGKILDNETIAELGEYARARCAPLTNVCDEPDWRKQMIPVYTARACQVALQNL